MRFLIAFVVATLCLSIPYASSQNLNRGPCCNTQTGQFVDIEDITACNALPGHLHTKSVDQTNMMQLMGCLQNSSREAMKALQDYQQGGGNVPGGQIPPNLGIGGMMGGGQITSMQDLLGGGNVPTMDDVPVQCCDTLGGGYVGIEAPVECRARGARFVPEAPDTLSETNICRPATAGDGGAWDKEEFEANITHADMEDWQDDNTPDGFVSWGPDPSLTQETGLDLQVTFRSPDAHTGQWSMRMKPVDILPQVPEQGQAVTAAATGKPYILSPTGAMTCKEPCNSAAPSMAASQNLYASLDAEEVKSHVCGAYKGFIGHLDQLKLDVSVHENGTPVGGLNAQITQSSTDWTTFAFPLKSLVDKALPKTSKVGMGLSVVPKANGGMPGLGGWDISPFTDVLVDSIHFCSPVKLMAFKPAVIDDEEIMIPESIEEREGVQTWVNSDNDDKDTAFDFEDSDGVNGDDELVHIKMQMPKNSFGNAELKVNAVGSKIKLWEDANKSKPFEMANQRVEVLELLRTTPDGERYERDVWVEAIAPSDDQKDILFEFIFENAMLNGEETSDKVAFTSLAPMKIDFKGQGNGEEKYTGNEADKSGQPGDTLLEDPNWPDGLGDTALRVFPGKSWEGSAPSSDPKDQVTVEITMNVEPVRPVKLYLKSFDIDDPLHSGDLVDEEKKERDNRGYEPGSAGQFVDGPGGPAPFEFEVNKKDMETPFQVTRQPGDNFRIAASGDKDQFRVLENDDAKIAGIHGRPATWIFDRDILDTTQDPAAARMARHDDVTSPVLTVWRRVWLEVDHMANVQKPKIEGTIVSTRTGPDEIINITENDVSVPVTLKVQWIKINKTLRDYLPTLSLREEANKDKVKDSWDKGSLKILYTDQAGPASYRVNGNTGNTGEYDEIKLANPKGYLSDLENLGFELKDDDGFEDGDALPKVDLSRMREVFAPAYILPMVHDDNLLPGSSDIPFQLHNISDQEIHLKEMMRPHFKNKDLDGDPYFWLVYIQNGYQGSMIEDGDGEVGALSGITDNNLQTGKGGWGFIVNQESARESQFNYSKPKGTPTVGWRLSDIAPHEMGHMFGGSHNHSLLMSQEEIKNPPIFDENTLKAARDRQFP